MADINNIIYLIDEYLESHKINCVTPSEVSAYIAKNEDMPSDGGKFLRKLLREGKIPNAVQSKGKGSSWYILHSNNTRALSTSPAHVLESGIAKTEVPTSGVITESLAPIADSDSEILILGTLPGKVSLETQHYYANKGNQFWKIISSLFDETMPFEYDDRLRLLKRHHIALWDLLKSADRISSLDSDIKNPAVNDIIGFISTHTKIRVIGLNGNKASTYFRTLVNTSKFPKNIRIIPLPSSSSTNTHLTLETKINCWKTILK